MVENDHVLKLINQSKLKIGDIADCVTGFYSGDDKRFLQVVNYGLKNGKNYNLINKELICMDYKNKSDILNGIEDEKYFIPIVKGGNTKYLKADNWFMNWSKDAVQHYKTDKKARFQNPKYYFKLGIAVPMVSASTYYRFFD
jgi:adenine-specific DNA-methyltransferase